MMSVSNGSPVLWPAVFVGLLAAVMVVGRKVHQPAFVKKFNIGVFILGFAWILTFVFSIAGPHGYHPTI